MGSMELLLSLLPGTRQLEFEAVEVEAESRQIVIRVKAQQEARRCPMCQRESQRLHSHYVRTLRDLPWADFSVVIILESGKWFCQNPSCERRIFTERLPGIAVPWARRTQRLAEVQTELGLTVGGRAGACLSKLLCSLVSRDTLIRLVRRQSIESATTPRVLGIDDWAKRKGQSYGTILVDLETHQVVEVLPERSAECVEQWLKAHPGVEIISRDRSKDYQRGATDGAPQAQQVIDRWHLLKNLREAIERFLSHTQAPEDTSEAGSLAVSPRQQRTSGERARSQGSRQRRLALYQQVQELYRQGGTILGIARQLHLGHRRVRKFVRSPEFPEWGKPARTQSAIDPYRPYLQERWQQGCHATSQLWQELQERGFSGSRMMVYRWAQLQQDEGERATGQSQPNKNTVANQGAPRHLAWLFLRDPEHLEKQEQQTLSFLRQAPLIEKAYGLTQQFVALLKERNALPLDTWLRECLTSGVSDLATFAASGWRKRARLCTRPSLSRTAMDPSRAKSTSSNILSVRCMAEAVSRSYDKRC